MTIDERVAAGAAFLDERDPDWWREDVLHAIDLDRLDLMSDDLCVLGQRFGDYSDGLTRCGAVAISLGQECDYGFLADMGSPWAWEDLTLAWSVLIMERRKRAAEKAAQITETV